MELKRQRRESALTLSRGIALAQYFRKGMPEDANLANIYRVESAQPWRRYKLLRNEIYKRLGGQEACSKGLFLLPVTTRRACRLRWKRECDLWGPVHGVAALGRYPVPRVPEVLRVSLLQIHAPRVVLWLDDQVTPHSLAL